MIDFLFITKDGEWKISEISGGSRLYHQSNLYSSYKLLSYEAFCGNDIRDTGSKRFETFL